MSVLVSGGGSRGGSSGLRGYRNRLINGDFSVDQRNAGAAETISAAANNYALDRWAGFATAAAGTFYLQQTFNSAVSDVYYMVMSCNGADASLAAGDLYVVSQFIEGNNVYDLVWGTASAKSVTLSFEAYSNITGTFAVSIRNSALNRSWLGSYTINAAGAWERKTITIPGDTSGTWLTTNGIGMGVTFTMAGGSTFQGAAGWQAGNLYTLAGMTNMMGTLNNYILLRKVQLEAGSSATEFERLPYDVQLMRCQRYYEKSFEMATAPAQNAGIGGAFRLAQGAGASATQVSWITFNTRKRTAATVTTYNPLAADAQVRNQSTSTNATATSVSGYEDGGYLSFTTVAGSAVSNLNAVHWTADAEL